MPMVSAPPGRLSTITGWPSSFDSAGPTRRAMLSVALPAACGTTRRIGRSGNSAAALVAARLSRNRKGRSMRIGRMVPPLGLPVLLLRVELAANLAAFVRGAVHVDVEAAGLEGRHLR